MPTAVVVSATQLPDAGDHANSSRALGRRADRRGIGLLDEEQGPRRLGPEPVDGSNVCRQNACNPDNHKRPFIIEWDATDRSSFEAQAASDVIFVKYEGCQLTVLDECRNESIRGEKGAYMPPEWTSGALETIDIKTEGELVAKLPLGVATLGGRVAGGEAFHMEYYVAGTRNATRDAVYRNELADNPGCEGATHFVHGYNLGAFALGSAENIEVSAGGSAYGFGAEGKASKSKSAEKKGGDLAVCKADDATEVQDCQTPIRLSLRSIRDGDNPDEAAKAAPDNNASLNAAGQIAAKLEMGEDARAHFEAAQRKFNARDGNGCIKELNAYDKLDPKHKSTDPNQALAYYRASCLMLAGKCSAGKKMMRKVVEKGPTANMTGPEGVDRAVQQSLNTFCQGSLPPRDDLLRSIQALAMASTQKKSAAFCTKHFKVIKKHRTKVKPKDDEDHQLVRLDRNMQAIIPRCYARAGDCKRAWATYQEITKWLESDPEQYYGEDRWKKMSAADKKKALGMSFDGVVDKCKGKGR